MTATSAPSIPSAVTRQKKKMKNQINLTVNQQV
jgi:hypothetical protein